MAGAVFVRSAQPQSASIVEEGTVTVTNADRLNRYRFKDRDRLRHVFVPRSTKSSLVVASPGVHVALGSQGQIVERPDSDRNDFFTHQGFHQGWFLTL